MYHRHETLGTDNNMHENKNGNGSKNSEGNAPLGNEVRPLFHTTLFSVWRWYKVPPRLKGKDIHQPGNAEFKRNVLNDNVIIVISIFILGTVHSVVHGVIN